MVLSIKYDIQWLGGDKGDKGDKEDKEDGFWVWYQ